MGLPRFFITGSDIACAPGEIEIAAGDIVRQMARVLRLGAGDRVLVLDGAGGRLDCTIVSIAGGTARLRIDTSGPASGDPSVKVTVVLPLLKGHRFDWALAKLAELGAGSIVPAVCRRSVVRWTGEAGRKLARWRSILREAAEQSERATIPHIVEPLAWEQLGSVASESEVRLLCAARSAAPRIATILSDSYAAGTAPASVCIAVGPEGGLTEAEMETALSHSFLPVSLGPRILRTETAAVHATGLVIDWYGD